MNDLVTTIVDEETGEQVTITEELRFEARKAHEDIVHHGSQTFEHLLRLGVSLQTMRDRRLYLALGSTSFEAYCRTELAVSSNWANRQIVAASVLNDPSAPVHQIPSRTHLILLARLPTEERREFLQEHNVSDMTKRELEAKIREINSAKRQNEALAQRLAAAEAKLADPLIAPEPVIVHQTPPEVLAQVAELRKELKRSEAQAAELLAQSHGTAEAKRALEAERAKVKAMQKRLHRLSNQFDDQGRDQYGGSKLIDAMDPLFLWIPQILAEVRVLKRVGVGGPCDEDRLSALIPQIRELADSLTEILKDRANRSINVTEGG